MGDEECPCLMSENMIRKVKDQLKLIHDILTDKTLLNVDSEDNTEERAPRMANVKSPRYNAYSFSETSEDSEDNTEKRAPRMANVKSPRYIAYSFSKTSEDSDDEIAIRSKRSMEDGHLDSSKMWTIWKDKIGIFMEKDNTR